MPGPAQRLLAHLGDAGQRVHERAQAVAVERHQPAHALDLHVLHAAEDRHRHLLPAPHDAGRAHVLLGQVVERPGHAVAVGLRRVLRHAAHHDDDLLRRPAARAGLAGQQVRDARRQPRVGHDGHAGGARLGAQVERVLGAERDVHEVAPRRDGRLHGAEAVARRQRPHDEVVPGHQARERLGRRAVGLLPGEVGGPGQARVAQVGDGDVRGRQPRGEVGGDDAALLAAAQDEDALRSGRPVVRDQDGLLARLRRAQRVEVEEQQGQADQPETGVDGLQQDDPRENESGPRQLVAEQAHQQEGQGEQQADAEHPPPPAPDQRLAVVQRAPAVSLPQHDDLRDERVVDGLDDPRDEEQEREPQQDHEGEEHRRQVAWRRGEGDGQRARQVAPLAQHGPLGEPGRRHRPVAAQQDAEEEQRPPRRGACRCRGRAAGPAPATAPWPR